MIVGKLQEAEWGSQNHITVHARLPVYKNGPPAIFREKIDFSKNYTAPLDIWFRPPDFPGFSKNSIYIFIYEQINIPNFMKCQI